MATEHYTAEQVIEAAQRSRGIKAVAAQRLGCSRNTVENYINRYPTVRRAFEEQRQVLIDVAEGQMAKKVDAGEWPAIKFVLVTLGKDRGYIERQEMEHSGAIGSYVVDIGGDDDSSSSTPTT